MEERWDLYDHDRQSLGITIRRGEPIPAGCYHLVVHFCLFSSDGRLLCQRRSLTKPTYPYFWDVTVGGAALAGETSQQAVHREVLEEIGLDIDFSAMEPAFSNVFIEFIDDYYFLVMDIDPSALSLQKEEVCAVRFFTLKEVRRMIRDKDFVQFSAIDQIQEVHGQLFGE
ncbi:MAG: NUDIX domain-containing protein [Erysipelotrichaceae bacterium]|nr:NUDIX domain-containing protein [Erysipelotrichaceae bacterium]